MGDTGAALRPTFLVPALRGCSPVTDDRKLDSNACQSVGRKGSLLDDAPYRDVTSNAAHASAETSPPVKRWSTHIGRAGRSVPRSEARLSRVAIALGINGDRVAVWATTSPNGSCGVALAKIGAVP